MISVVAALLLAQVDAGSALVAPPMLEAVNEAADAKAENPEGAAAVSAQKEADKVHQVARVFLKGGQVLEGWLEARDETGVSLGINGHTVLLPAALIEKVEVNNGAYQTASGAIYFRDPNRTRYLYSPSAMMLKKGEFSFSQVELVLTSFTYGLTDFLTVQAGTALPIWFIPPFPAGVNFVVGAKAGGSITEKFHLAAGAQTLFVPGVGAGQGGFPMVGILFGTATYGDADVHVSLSAGVPFSALAGTGFAAPAISISANYRVARPVALVSENWLILGPQSGTSFILINSIAARAMGEHIAVDIGLVTLFSDAGAIIPFPVPWVTFTYNFN